MVATMVSLARSLCAAAVLAALAACGGGGDVSQTGTYSLEWDKPSYRITAPSSSAGPLYVDAYVTPHGQNLPAQMAIDITPSGAGANPGPGTGPFWMNDVGQIPVRISVSSMAGPGTYPYGVHTFTAIMHIGGGTYTAVTTVMVSKDCPPGQIC